MDGEDADATPAGSRLASVTLVRVNRDQMLTEVRTLCELPIIEGLVRFHGAFYTAEDGRISIALEYMNGLPRKPCPLANPGRTFPASTRCKALLPAACLDY
eukprot:1181283-Prorocentrum_minimum.AAC.1